MGSTMIKDFSTSCRERRMISDDRHCVSSLQTTSAVSRNQLPKHTDDKTKHVLVHLIRHSSIRLLPRKVCRQRGRSRPAGASQSKRRSNCSSILLGLNERVRAAANSIARGKPSRRRQISAAKEAFYPLIENLDWRQ